MAAAGAASFHSTGFVPPLLKVVATGCAGNGAGR